MAESDNEMKVTINPSRASTLLENISSIQSRVQSASKANSLSSPPRLVAVSKLKPASDVLALHSPPSGSNAQPHFHFGENYVQEMLEKSKLLPSSIRWHFIGGLQSNKCAQLAREVKSLWAVESVDSEKKAGLLNKGRGEMLERRKEDGDSNNGDSAEDGRLRVFVQVNTSGEDSKSGLAPGTEELLNLCRYVRDECQHLKLQGVMTIGAIARSKASTPETENEDFVSLRDTRDHLAGELGIEKNELELSMGMSEDFEAAIAQGSNEVRVGSTIFGERPPKKDAKVIEETEKEKS